MKITNIKSFLFRPSSERSWMGQNIQKHWLFVKVETDEGITAGENLLLSRIAREVSFSIFPSWFPTSSGGIPIR